MASSSFPAVSWLHMKAPTIGDMAVLVEHVFNSFPEEIIKLCGNVTFNIEDIPEQEIIESLGLDSPFEMLGLFQSSSPRKKGDLSDKWDKNSNIIWLYRRPILDYWVKQQETLHVVITRILVHEIAHHFGLSEDEKDKMETQIVI